MVPPGPGSRGSSRGRLALAAGALAPLRPGPRPAGSRPAGSPGLRAHAEPGARQGPGRASPRAQVPRERRGARDDDAVGARPPRARASACHSGRGACHSGRGASGAARPEVSPRPRATPSGDAWETGAGPGLAAVPSRPPPRSRPGARPRLGGPRRSSPGGLLAACRLHALGLRRAARRPPPRRRRHPSPRPARGCPTCVLPCRWGQPVGTGHGRRPDSAFGGLGVRFLGELGPAWVGVF